MIFLLSFILPAELNARKKKHTDKGFCLPTIFLWMLFLYLEGAIRWKDDSKNIPHVDLCRPFAAHWYVTYNNTYYIYAI